MNKHPETVILHIKNMVCPRCISSVRDILTNLGLQMRSVRLGQAEVEPTEKPLNYDQIDKALRQNGFELLRDRDQQLVEHIKNTLLSYLYALEKEETAYNASDFLEEKLGFSYSHLSKIFSNYESTTIEKYLIYLKIERVKELLSYGELTLSEIAFRLQYSSSQHLSTQFKKITGMTVTGFKAQPFIHRHSLDHPTDK